MAPFRRLVLASAVLLPLALGLAGCRSRAGRPAGSATGNDAVAAEVEGDKILMAEVDRRVLEQFARDQMWDLRKRVLDQVVGERLLDREAKKRGVTRDELLKQEVEGKIAAPRPDDVKAHFDISGLEGRGGTFEQMRPQIEKSLRDQAMAGRRAAFMDELRKNAKVTVLLTEPRVTLTLPADAPAMGPDKAPVTMVEFLDYQCPYCHRVQGVIDQVMSLYPGKVRFVHRDFPLEGMHPQAMKAARAARCAGEQGKFWEYHRSLLAEPGQEDADLSRRATALSLDTKGFDACVASDRHDAAIRGALTQGQEVGVSGTPTFFINGRRLVGVRGLQDFQKVINEELARS